MLKEKMCPLPHHKTLQQNFQSEIQGIERTGLVSSQLNLYFRNKPPFNIQFSFTDVL